MVSQSEAADVHVPRRTGCKIVLLFCLFLRAYRYVRVCMRCAPFKSKSVNGKLDIRAKQRQTTAQHHLLREYSFAETLVHISNECKQASKRREQSGMHARIKYLRVRVQREKISVTVPPSVRFLPVNAICV
ncbi:uncharacterized protein LOC119631579 isoform X2 [Glossina fuscipes]|uniref:Uncharacterized protein LOC119631579 isoform X2 n=1 Tax=Glossina fuscipes TaxID=7396 RepID=A0A8U0W3U3_9MUSC|nr:uncharacterized protein LOC119631579 isoform X2 [Glossina fuscipes]